MSTEHSASKDGGPVAEWKEMCACELEASAEYVDGVANRAQTFNGGLRAAQLVGFYRHGARVLRSLGDADTRPHAPGRDEGTRCKCGRDAREHEVHAFTQAGDDAPNPRSLIASRLCGGFDPSSSASPVVERDADAERLARLADEQAIVWDGRPEEADWRSIAAALRTLSKSPEDAAPDAAGCAECGRRYGDEFGFPDLLVPNWAWRRISPRGDEGGLICPSCIVKRLVASGLSDVPAMWASGPLVGVPYRDGFNGGREWLEQPEAPDGGGEPVAWRMRKLPSDEHKARYPMATPGEWIVRGVSVIPINHQDGSPQWEIQPLYLRPTPTDATGDEVQETDCPRCGAVLEVTLDEGRIVAMLDLPSKQPVGNVVAEIPNMVIYGPHNTHQTTTAFEPTRATPKAPSIVAQPAGDGQVWDAVVKWRPMSEWETEENVGQVFVYQAESESFGVDWYDELPNHEWTHFALASAPIPAATAEPSQVGCALCGEYGCGHTGEYEPAATVAPTLSEYTLPGYGGIPKPAATVQEDALEALLRIEAEFARTQPGQRIVATDARKFDIVRAALSIRSPR